MVTVSQRGCRTVALAVGIATVAVACNGGSDSGSATAAHNASTRPANGAAGATVTGSAAGPDTPPDTGPLMIGDHAVIRTQAVGPLHVGEWRRPVMSFVYAMSARAGRDSEDIIVVRGIGHDTVTLTFDNDTLRKIFVTHTGPRTRDGIGVGTPFTALTARTDATIATRGSAHVATLPNLCGVEFATDSVALSPDTLGRRAAKRDGTIRAISIGYCSK